MKLVTRRWLATGVLSTLLAATLASSAFAAPAGQSTALVQTANNATLGPILVNSQGATLYTLSSEGSGQFTCTGSCLTVWPALLLPAGVTTPSAGPGVTGPLGSVTRPDGTVQATYNGFPLYTFVGDTGAGQTSGEGVTSFGGTWHVAKLIPSASPGASPTATTAAPPPPAASGPLVSMSQDPVLGGLLVNAQGMTLYYNTAEEGNHIVCSGKCLGVWPPLTPGATAPTAGPGVTGTLGVTSRPDGIQQVTYNGVPLYTFVKDTAPGQTHGQGIKAFGGTWFAAQIFGTPLAATPVVPLTIHITRTGSTVWGKVVVKYTLNAKQQSLSCSKSTCMVLVPMGIIMHISQTPLNSATWPFQEWKITPSGGTTIVNKASAFTRKLAKATSVTAVYVLHT